MNLSWLAEIVFFASYFIAWITGEISNVGGKGDLWLAVSAWAALFVAVCLLFYNAGPLVREHTSRPPQV
jgi:hypothetical protein